MAKSNKSDTSSETSEEVENVDERYEYLYDAMSNIVEKNKAEYLILNNTVKSILTTLDTHKTTFYKFHEEYLSTCDVYNASLNHICDSIASIKMELENIDSDIKSIKQQLVNIGQLNKQVIETRTYLLNQNKKADTYEGQIAALKTEIKTMQSDINVLKRINGLR